MVMGQSPPSTSRSLSCGAVGRRAQIPQIAAELVDVLRSFGAKSDLLGIVKQLWR
jgi:hypothetical protein